MKMIDDINLDGNDRLAITKVAGIIRGATEVDGILLFGSKARGDDGPESDIDLLVVTRRRLSRSERHEIVDLIYPVQLEHGVVFSPLFVSVEEWNTGPVSVLPIRFEIDDHGVAA